MPMSLYHHVANKDEIHLPPRRSRLQRDRTAVARRRLAWPELHRRAISARPLSRRHPWAIGLMESRATLGPLDAAPSRRDHRHTARRPAPPPLIAHAYALLNSYIYGSASQEAMLPFSGPDTCHRSRGTFFPAAARRQVPLLRRDGDWDILQPGHDFGSEFEFGLGVILDALAGADPGCSARWDSDGSAFLRVPNSLESSMFDPYPGTRDWSP